MGSRLLIVGLLVAHLAVVVADSEREYRLGPDHLILIRAVDV